jgi:hypothetical protein
MCKKTNETHETVGETPKEEKRSDEDESPN